MEAITPAVEHVLPRPVSPLPTPSIATATRKLADKLNDLFGMSDQAAMAFAQAVVDPAAARRALENAEQLPVPGGTVLAVRADVWSRFVMPDPRNPRIGPARRHPASDVIGTDETSRFRPLPEPSASADGRPEVTVTLKNSEHLAWAAQQAHDYVLAQNDWRDSIKTQGVMTEVWLVAGTFEHGNGKPPVTVPITAEGSSRMTAVHDILDVRSADVPYTRDDRKHRAHIRKLNDVIGAAGNPDQVEAAIAAKIRCEKVPALLLVGFEPHNGTTADFAVAVKSLVALRHVDYPKPWGEATENEALADAVLDELEHRGLLTPARRDWLAGALTPAEADEAGFSRDPAIRAAAIARLATEKTPEVHDARRVAITSQSTRKNITTKLLLDVATSLVMRSVPEEDAHRRERLRRYLKEAYSVELARDWTATNRPADQVAAAALAELSGAEPGPASRELAARSAYPLIVTGGLTGDRGSRDNDQPDRRKPGEVLDRMRETAHGVHQMRQALDDFASGARIRAVDEHGEVLQSDDGVEHLVRDRDLRLTFRPAGEPASTPGATTPAELLQNELAELGHRVREVEDAVKRVEAVSGDDGRPTIEVLGADRADCDAWTETLLAIVTRKLPLWGQRNTQRHGVVEADFEDDYEEDLDENDHDDDMDEVDEEATEDM
jgi:hypothetical protein